MDEAEFWRRAVETGVFWRDEASVRETLLAVREAAASLVRVAVATEDSSTLDQRELSATVENIRAAQRVDPDGMPVTLFNPRVLVDTSVMMLGARGRLRWMFVSDAQIGGAWSAASSALLDEQTRASDRGDSAAVLDVSRRLAARTARLSSIGELLDAYQRGRFSSSKAVAAWKEISRDPTAAAVVAFSGMCALVAAELHDVYSGDMTAWWREYKASGGVVTFASALRQRAFVLDTLAIVTLTCAVCATRHANDRCSRCSRMRYCGAQCQAIDWPRHRAHCRRLVNP